MSARYEVVIPWHGVKAGDVLELERVHPAWAPNLRRVEAPLEVATPSAASPQPERQHPRRKRKEQ